VCLASWWYILISKKSVPWVDPICCKHIFSSGRCSWPDTGIYYTFTLLFLRGLLLGWYFTRFFYLWLFNDAISSSHYVALSDRIINGMDAEESSHGLILRYYPSLEGYPVRIASLWTEIWIPDLLNTKEGC
jgi:hypothetical protein